MNSFPFFNYPNLSGTLPEGCKDLIDVLKLKSANAKQSAEVSLQPANVGLGLADLATYVSRFLESHAKVRSLWIHGDATFVIGVMCGKRGLHALILVNLSREQAVRTVFSDSGFVPIQDDFLSNNMRGLQYKFSSIPDLGGFIRELLTQGFGVTANTGLWFRYHEKDAA
jgi:hypothetical protein